MGLGILSIFELHLRHFSKESNLKFDCRLELLSLADINQAILDVQFYGYQFL